MNGINYIKPTTLEQAWELKEKNPGSRYIAGGTDLMVKIKNQEIQPSTLISLRSIGQLSSISVGQVTRIGAMATISDLINHPELGKRFPVLIQAAKRIGSPQIRNAGTIGGNLCNCSPCADTAPPLLILEARVILKSSKNSREISMADFFQGPGQSCLSGSEILTEFILEKPDPNSQAIFFKRGRVKMDLAIASLATLLEMDGNTCKKIRIAAGSVAPTPIRLLEVEKILENEIMSSEKIDQAQKIARDTISPITDIRSSEEYRRQSISVFLKRSIQILSGRKKE